MSCSDMELGNMIFGNSRGSYEVDRGLSDIFYEFTENSNVFSERGHMIISDYELYGNITKRQTNAKKYIKNWIRCVNSDCKSHELIKTDFKCNNILNQYFTSKDNIMLCTTCRTEFTIDEFLEEIKTEAINDYNDNQRFKHLFQYHNQQDGSFENDTFLLRPYIYDEECNCDYDDKEYRFFKKLKHSKECYQSLKKDIQKEYPDDYNNQFRDMDNKINQYNVEVEKLCKRMNLTYPDGAGVHCTCDYNNISEKWLSENYHKQNCQLIKPHFWHKKSNLKIIWYKYPFRDSYSNIEFTANDFKKILEDCQLSLKSL